MRNISFSLTTDQFKDRTKTVTRRLGWANLKPGDLLRGCKKCMGMKRGEKVEALGVIRVVSVVRETVSAIGLYADDCAKEGFPEMSPDEFVEMFCKHMKCKPNDFLNRIEFEYLPVDLLEWRQGLRPVLPSDWRFEALSEREPWLTAVDKKTGNQYFIAREYAWPRLIATKANFPYLSPGEIYIDLFNPVRIPGIVTPCYAVDIQKGQQFWNVTCKRCGAGVKSFTEAQRAMCDACTPSVRSIESIHEPTLSVR